MFLENNIIYSCHGKAVLQEEADSIQCYIFSLVIVVYIR